MVSLFSYPKRKLRKLVRDGEYAEAVKFGEQIRDRFENDPDFAFIMGGIHYMVDEPKKALSYFEEADILRPGDVETLKLKANAHLALGQREEAAKCCKEILEADPRQDEARSLLGQLG